ncbi:MAG: hypothetical protein GXY65_11025 [Rhodococcus sp.]|uniref:hypothetical protein n=1 Tax=Rhodococcus sp. TaxID=1831 RepID=UPI0016B03F5F|nr:hypothetical protein [Rhodococcus sp. (in: high G+C Gram-positive bacteria)]NLV79851.1 hypothetical protein [Rhodococcus sp. (in: high G+C Gram-positive bacteria)]
MRVRVVTTVTASAVLLLTGCGGSADGSVASPTVEAQPTATTTATTTAVTTTEVPAPAVPETTTDTAASTTEVPAPTSLVDVQFEQNESYYFTSPDGQFTCGIVQLPGRTEAGCEGITDPVPPQPDDCMVNWGHGMRVVDSGEGEFLCSGGPVYLPVEGTASVLPAGAPLSQLGYTCVTTAVDVTCVNDGTRHGFTIASSSNETF